MKTKPDIVQEVERRGIRLRKAGREFNGLCPFHEDKHPFFSVSEEKGVFHCFGCGESGDAFDFVMRFDACTFCSSLSPSGKLVSLRFETVAAARSGVSLATAAETTARTNRLAEQI